MAAMQAESAGYDEETDFAFGLDLILNAPQGVLDGRSQGNRLELPRLC